MYKFQYLCAAEQWLTKLELSDKPGTIINADETGIGKKDNSNTEKVLGTEDKPTYQKERFAFI